MKKKNLIFVAVILSLLMLSCTKKDDPEIASEVPSNNIVFTTIDKIYKIDINSKVQQEIFRCDSLSSYGDIQLSPNKKKIFFSAKVRNSNRQIFTLNLDGTGVKQISNQNFDVLYPVLSPDGSKISFVKYGYPKSYLCIVDATGKNETIILSAENLCYPIWSPDGSKIAMQAGLYSYYAQIIIINTDGSEVKELTNFSSPFGYNRNKMCWTNDSKKIIFSTTTTSYDRGSIGYINISDKSSKWLTSSGEDGMIDISPNGEKIAFISRRDGNEEIYTMDFDGKNQKRLIISTLYESTPKWLSDSKRIAYLYRGGSNDILYIINSDGTDQLQLTEGISYNGLSSFDL
ncbi:MAG: hypothetical protein WCJ03_00180 [Bacteroidales bacterium]